MYSGSRSLKKEFLRQLEDSTLEELFKYSDGCSAQSLINVLFSSLCSGDERVRWFTVSVFGRVMARLAEKEMERARIVMRRLMWMLNDESGGIGWGVPEAFAESLAGHGTLAKEYDHILVSFMRPEGFYLELEALQRGLMWGVGRAAQNFGDLLVGKNAAELLQPYLESGDTAVRGLAAWALGNLGEPGAEKKLQDLLSDEGPLRLYERGLFVPVTVMELAAGALVKISNH